MQLHNLGTFKWQLQFGCYLSSKSDGLSSLFRQEARGFFVISGTHLFETPLAEETEGFVNSFFRIFIYRILPTW